MSEVNDKDVIHVSALLVSTSNFFNYFVDLNKHNMRNG